MKSASCKRFPGFGAVGISFHMQLSHISGFYARNHHRGVMPTLIKAEIVTNQANRIATTTASSVDFNELLHSIVVSAVNMIQHVNFHSCLLINIQYKPVLLTEC